ncbi:MAG TPA: ABC transporter ATP-binding protein [Gemmatimonadaceae bacterium]|nr:ABC transporter ATP-binding protein [Gemmatimonadaceae bacterium]
MTTAASVAPGSPLVSVRALTKRFRVRRSWREVQRRPFTRILQTSVDRMSFDVHGGEFFGLLGPNGAGKTTLLKVLATFILPDEGEVRIDGYDVVREPNAVRARVAPVIANERSLFWRLTARENLELFAHLWGVPKAEVSARIGDVLEVVGLANTGRKMVGQFSSGMLQRLLIARALLPEPRVLLLDEPTRSLDPVSAREFRHFLRDELAMRRNCAVIIATHNADEALELCTRVGVMNGGKLLAIGTAQELAQRVGDDRYTVWTDTPDHPALRALTPASTVKVATPSNGWTPVSVRAVGGERESAALLADLVRAGVPVARFERARVSLAELIEAVIQTSPDNGRK